jgi:Txe/YoeB family toxin of toxin-antitoxin system
MVGRSKKTAQIAAAEPSHKSQPWTLLFSKQAQKDASKLAAAGLKPKAMALLELIAENPFQTPPPCEKLVGDLQGAYSRRINIQHRLVYQVIEDSREVRVLRLWTHYD